jgi:hypothetical protein
LLLHLIVLLLWRASAYSASECEGSTLRLPLFHTISKGTAGGAAIFWTFACARAAVEQLLLLLKVALQQFTEISRNLSGDDGLRGEVSDARRQENVLQNGLPHSRKQSRSFAAGSHFTAPLLEGSDVEGA